MKKHFATFVYAVLGGISIGLGGTVFLRLKDAFAGGNVVGAILFMIGLFVICTRGYNLYTGKVCYVFNNKPNYLITVGIIWIGNLIGCMAIAGAEHLTSLCGTESGINIAAQGLVDAKMNASYLSLFVLGIICNIFIYLAVNGYANNPHQLGKYMAIFLGVSIFILAGTEHSIADMYYWALSGRLYSDFGGSILRIIVISLGNAVGGVLFPLLEMGAKKLTAESK